MKPQPSLAARQRGAYAVEFAIVFPLFFALFYALLSYGIAFGLRLGLQNAAEEGARAGLRYQVVAGSQLPARLQAAQTKTTGLVTWLPFAPTVSAQVCLLGGACSDGSGTVACGANLDPGCTINVTVSYPYAQQPIAPPLPGFGIFMPETLVGRASILLDGRAL
ncbi:TadE/TadG family type IV pilus assembly protein [Hydrogenophaga sp.]|uniref:TadE/TadG family type IV pilus assembly protein n=1 Tax=Hydrogenophaga sp. TaxID=1904254 RepID=UPI003565DA0F